MFVRRGGVTLIELIVAIMIMSIALAGILVVLDVTVSQSADPLVRKQAQALAEGLLEEVQLGLFAYCDGADPLVYYATSDVDCTAGMADTYGPEASESRPYDTVKDYASAAHTPTAIPAISLGGDIAAPDGYSATVEIRESPLGGVVTDDSLDIIVRVTGPNDVKATVEGFRLRTKPK